MGGKVPPEDMDPERVSLLRLAKSAAKDMHKNHLLDLVRALTDAAQECPRSSCAFCEHQSRAEAQKQRQSHVGEAEAG